MFMLPYGFSLLAAGVREFAVRLRLIGCDVSSSKHFPRRPIASRALTLHADDRDLSWADSEARTGPCRGSGVDVFHARSTTLLTLTLLQNQNGVQCCVDHD
jgi:hypothetical protein